MVAAATDRAGIASVPQDRVSGDALPGLWIGGQIVRLGPLDRHHRSAQGAREHLVDMGPGDDPKPQQHILVYFGTVLFLLPMPQHRPDTSPPGVTQLFFHTP